MSRNQKAPSLICYDLMEGLTYEEEDPIFEIKPKLLSISTIIIFFKKNLLNVGVLEIKSIEEFDPKQGT